MKMIDLESHKIIDVTEHYEIRVPLSLRREMELTLSEFDEVFNKQLDDAFASIKLDEVNMAAYFIIHTDLGKEDRELMGDFILTRFIPYIISKEIPEGRERRLGVPKDLELIHIQYATMVDLINRYEHIKQFNIGIATRSGKNIINLVG
jgi:hypothetical protein